MQLKGKNKCLGPQNNFLNANVLCLFVFHAWVRIPHGYQETQSNVIMNFN
jgi:hypothetical protein